MALDGFGAKNRGTVREPLFSLDENRGFGVFRSKYKQHLRENGVVATLIYFSKICDLFSDNLHAPTDLSLKGMGIVKRFVRRNTQNRPLCYA